MQRKVLCQGVGAGTLSGKLQWGPLVMWASLVPPPYKILNPTGSHRGQIMPWGCHARA